MQIRNVAANYKLAAIDCETTGLSPQRDSLLGVGIFAQPGQSWYFNASQKEEFRSRILTLERAGYKFVNHHAKFDRSFLKAASWLDETFNFDYWFDPKTAIPLLADRPASNKLEPACVHYLQVYPWKDLVYHKNLQDATEQELKEYCLIDCVHTVNLAVVLLNKLYDEGQWEFYFNKLMPLDNLLATASDIGIRINPERVEVKREEYVGKLDQLKQEFRALGGDRLTAFEELMLNQELSEYSTEKSKAKVLAKPPRLSLTSPKQLLSFFTKFCGLSMKDPYGKPGVGEDALYHNQKDPLIAKFIEIKDAEKPVQFFDTWLKVRDVNNRLHTNFNVDVARTGRLSSSGDLNIQQIPVRKDPSIRDCFIPGPGHKFVIRDLAAIEPRILAHYSQDPGLLDIFNNNLSLYGGIASRIGLWDGDPEKLKEQNKPVYNAAKTLVLGVLYGMGSKKMAFSMSKATGREYTPAMCRDMISAFFKGFAKVLDLREAVINRAEKVGMIRNFFGRKVYISREKAYTTAMNSLIQSSASDFMALAQLDIQKVIGNTGSKLLALVHDELIWECPDPVAFRVDRYIDRYIRSYAEKLGIRVPIYTEGGVCTSWGSERVSWEELPDGIEIIGDANK